MKVFVDCGTHLAEGLARVIELENITSDWLIYSYEANPHTYELVSLTLKQPLPKKYVFLKWQNFSRIHAAVWVHSNGVKFFPAKLELDYKIKTDEEVSSFLKNHDDQVTQGLLLMPHQGHFQPVDGASTIYLKRQSKFLKKFGNSGQKLIQFKNIINVPSVDIQLELRKIVTQGTSKVVIKLDIEGAEFRVLNRILLGKFPLKKFNFYIEWHDYGVFYLRIYKILLKYALRFKGAKVYDWM